MDESSKDKPWYIFKQKSAPHDGIKHLPDPPAWRDFKKQREDAPGRDDDRGRTFQISSPHVVEMVNAALYLRRPLLVTGNPGTGKSSLAHAVRYQLKLDRVLYWPITTRSTLQDGLYEYDAIGRLQETEMFRGGSRPGDAKAAREPHANGAGEPHAQGAVEPDAEATCEPPSIGRYITLGPLGTALLPAERPRVLLIDEIDKSDIDLPNDLLNVFEEGGFSIPELKRLSDRERAVTVMTCDDGKAEIMNGEVKCGPFPFVVLTSNRERELPAPFLRRCLRLDIEDPDDAKLARIVGAHFEKEAPRIKNQVKALIKKFLDQRGENRLVSTDQLLNAVYLAAQEIDMPNEKALLAAIMRDLNEAERF